MEPLGKCYETLSFLTKTCFSCEIPTCHPLLCKELLLNELRATTFTGLSGHKASMAISQQPLGCQDLGFRVR